MGNDVQPPISSEKAFTIFESRGETACRDQIRLLTDWIKESSSRPTFDNPEEWLEQLQQCFADPAGSLTHKLFCLMLSHIIHVRGDEEKFKEQWINQFISQLHEWLSVKNIHVFYQTQNFIALLAPLLNDKQRSVFFYSFVETFENGKDLIRMIPACKALRSLVSSFKDDKERTESVNLIADKLTDNKSDDDVKIVAIYMFSNLAPSLKDDKKLTTKLVSLITDKLGDNNVDIQKSAIDALIAFAPSLKDDRELTTKLISLIKNKLGNNNVDIHKSAINALIAFVPSLKNDQNQTELVVSSTENEDVGDDSDNVKIDIIETSTKLALLLKDDKSRNPLLDPLLDSFLGMFEKNDSTTIKLRLFNSIETLVPLFNTDQQKKFFEALLKQLTIEEPLIKPTIIRTLSAFAPSLQRKKLLNVLLGYLRDENHNNNETFDVHEAAATAVASLIPFLSEPERKSITQLANTKNPNIFWLQLLNKSYPEIFLFQTGRKANAASIKIPKSPQNATKTSPRNKPS